MEKQELEILLNQLKSIILNKTFIGVEQTQNEDFDNVQQALAYLAECIAESNQFLREIASGNLAAPTPNRKNFLAGSAKELHAGLKHLTWQANRVASGDYNQNVSFLGEFSTSFNKMITQLKEREEKLQQQSDSLEQSNALMQSIMDGISECIIVFSQENNSLVYSNKPAEELVNNKNNRSSLCKEDRAFLLKNIIDNFAQNKKHMTNVIYCEISHRYFHIDTFSLQWNGFLSYVNRIIDITDEYNEKAQIENIAYTDELTGLYNRRYFMSKLEKLIVDKASFTLCLVDADKLKFANDSFGHSAGDEYLKTIAFELSSVSRLSDCVCRLGGDEFAMIFIACGLELVHSKMESVNKKLLSKSDDFSMSVSYGVVYVAEENTLTPRKILDDADKLMYAQKKLNKLKY